MYILAIFFPSVYSCIKSIPSIFFLHFTINSFPHENNKRMNEKSRCYSSYWYNRYFNRKQARMSFSIIAMAYGMQAHLMLAFKFILKWFLLKIKREYNKFMVKDAVWSLFEERNVIGETCKFSRTLFIILLFFYGHCFNDAHSAFLILLSHVQPLWAQCASLHQCEIDTAFDNN